MRLNDKQIEKVRIYCEKRDIGYCCGLYASLMRQGGRLPTATTISDRPSIDLDELFPEVKSKHELERELICCIRRVTRTGLSPSDIIRVSRRELSRIQRLQERRKAKAEKEALREHIEEKELTNI